MSDLQIAQIAGQGMNFERMRLEQAALKLSLASMEFSSNVDAVKFIEQLRQGGVDGRAPSKDAIALEVKKVQDTGNPLKDVDGYIYKFNIDPTHEMATLISATRAYEANVRAYNANGQMNKAALEIGGR